MIAFCGSLRSPLRLAILFPNFNSTMLPSYGLFIVIYLLFTLRKPASAQQYKVTLLTFQYLVLTLSVIAIAQFFAQFVIDGRGACPFYGIVPDFLFASYTTGAVNTVIPISEGSSLIKSNAIFLVESCTMFPSNST